MNVLPDKSMKMSFHKRSYYTQYPITSHFSKSYKIIAFYYLSVKGSSWKVQILFDKEECISKAVIKNSGVSGECGRLPQDKNYFSIDFFLKGSLTITQ